MRRSSSTFGEEPKIWQALQGYFHNYQEGLLELYKKIRPGEPLAVDSAETLINGMFFDPRRYDLAKVGRYKFNKKLAFKTGSPGMFWRRMWLIPRPERFIAEAGTDRRPRSWRTIFRTQRFRMSGFETEERRSRFFPI
jgi:DNA-directed RNA polymerase subunit beta